MGPRFRIDIDYGVEEPANEAQTKLPMKVAKPRLNALLEAAFSSVRAKLGDNPFKKITIQKIEAP